MEHLVSFDAVTDSINDILKDGLGGQAWATILPGIMSSAIEQVNACGVSAGCDSLVDSFVRLELWGDENIKKIDSVLSAFEQTLSSKEGSNYNVQVEYDTVTNNALLRWTEKTPQPVRYIDNLKEEYHHAVERSDYLPERLRRAFDELSRQ
jgi:hypothetical protein